MTTLTIYSPSGAVKQAAALRRAVRHLQGLGFQVGLDEAALLREQRFAGSDAQRLEAIHRVARSGVDVALAARGGYGLTRLLDGIDWKLIAHAIAHGQQWVGQSDLTALQLGLLAHARGCGPTWAGPMAESAFGVTAAEGGVDDITEACFTEAVFGQLEAIGFRQTGLARGATPHDGLEREGLLWGGNLSIICSLLGTPHWPDIRGGILFVEEVGEHPYRVERLLLQLGQAGVLDAQQAVLVGEVSDWKPAPNDRGYRLADAVAAVQARTRTPILQGLPHGHGPTKVCLPIGAQTALSVQGRDVMLAWGHLDTACHAHRH